MRASEKAMNASAMAGLSPAKLTVEGGPLTMANPRSGSGVARVTGGGPTGTVVDAAVGSSLPESTCEAMGRAVEAEAPSLSEWSGASVGKTTPDRRGDVGGVCIIR